MDFPSRIDAAILDRLRALRANDSDTVTTWMDDKTLCFAITGNHSGAACRTVRRRLKALTAQHVVMWKVINGRMFWALDEGQFRGAPELP